nr:hypothetical protein [Paenibacillus xylanexedens]
MDFISRDEEAQLNSLPLVGLLDSSSVHYQYEIEHPEKIIIIQNYFFLKDASHFNSWLTNQVEYSIIKYIWKDGEAVQCITIPRLAFTGLL